MPKRPEIRGPNLSGTPWATSACRGRPLLLLLLPVSLCCEFGMHAVHTAFSVFASRLASLLQLCSTRLCACYCPINSHQLMCSIESVTLLALPNGIFQLYSRQALAIKYLLVSNHISTTVFADADFAVRFI